MPSSQTRVVGSGFSTFRWNGKPIAFLESVVDSGQDPIANVEAIQPLDSTYPVEFALPRAMSYGTLTFTIRELWNMPVWQHLEGLGNAQNILDVWALFQAIPGTITCQTIIKPPQGGYWRVKTYHNVVVSQIADGESMAIGSMTVQKTVTCYYASATRATVGAGV
jgi:hypothetical protein